MSRAMRMHQWDQMAWLIFHIPRLGKSRRRQTVEDFHPIRRRSKRDRMAALDQYVNEMKTHLPEKLSQEESDRRWRAFKEKQSGKVS